MQLWKLGCRWGKGSGKPLFYDFIKSNNIVIGWVNKDYQIGDWLLITDGHTVLSLAKVISKRRSVLEFPQWETQVEKLEIPFEKDLFIYDAKFLNLKDTDRFLYPLQQGIVRVKGNDYIQTFKKLRTQYMVQENLSDHLNLLRYKKQIILQGPPGTGKTKLAKELAQALVLSDANREIIITDITGSLLPNLDIPTPTGYNTFKIVKHNIDSVTIYPKDAKNPYNIPYRDIIKSAKFYKLPEQDEASDTGGIKSYIISLANYIVESQITNQVQLMQFHPSFTYEDFVRGIVAESQGDRIEYKNVNKILGLFAKDANDNYALSKQDNLAIQQDKWIQESFNDFKEEIENEIEQNELTLSNNIAIFKVESDCFRYGKDWGVPSRINFVEFKKVIKAVLNQNLTLTQNTIPKEISVHAHHRFTYYLALLRIFFEKYNFEITNEKRALKNFVLIIDEINRANLSSVLGELIYALEYRGEKVESMYAVDGDNQLILPPNLYIIGTMNTADRSVGHIDYAIRRRFAFVDVLPKDLTQELGDKFHKALFDQVADLFGGHLSPEFERKDVQLGHSYFIDKTKDGGTMPIRLQYEIRPILNEYIKDGILTGENILQKIMDLKA
jgi:5-methylcytosine-specific restriction enzyme B